MFLNLVLIQTILKRIFPEMVGSSIILRLIFLVIVFNLSSDLVYAELIKDIHLDVPMNCPGSKIEPFVLKIKGSYIFKAGVRWEFEPDLESLVQLRNLLKKASEHPTENFRACARTAAALLTQRVARQCVIGRTTLRNSRLTAQQRSEGLGIALAEKDCYGSELEFELLLQNEVNSKFQFRSGQRFPFEPLDGAPSQAALDRVMQSFENCKKNPKYDLDLDFYYKGVRSPPELMQEVDLESAAILSREFLQGPDYWSKIATTLPRLCLEAAGRHFGKVLGGFDCMNQAACLQKKAKSFDLLSGAILQDRTSDAERSPHCILPSDGVSEIEEFTNLFQQLTPCLPLALNDPPILVENIPGSPSEKPIIPPKYQLSVIGNNPRTYQAKVNFDFKFPYYSDSVKKRQEMRARVTQCFASLKSRLAYDNPETGKREFLEIVLGDLNDPNPAPRHIVGVLEDVPRGNSQLWPIGAKCDFMTHETLHVLGLCDEYREEAIGLVVDPLTGATRQVEDVRTLSAASRRSGIQLAYNCRKTGRDDSIMSNSTLAFSKNYNLLSPEHFRAITAPGCLYKNKVYYECGQGAYMTDPTGRCLNLPVHCRPPAQASEGRR